MRKFMRVLDGLTASAQTPSRTEVEALPESLTSEHFQMCKTVRHGFPHQPTALAFDTVQKILAIGTKSGALRLLGRPGVDCHCQHESNSPVILLQFLVNEGALVSVCADDSLHLWNLRQKRPAILHSLKFNKERITCCHLPFQSKWLYIGSERGNLHVVNVESFVLSGYVVMWNKAIELSTKDHPGSVVHISDNPRDDGKLLVGYEQGTVVLWDLKSKKAEYRYYYDEAIHSVAWHHEGKQFLCSHSDGSLTMWNIRNPGKPAQIMVPHAKTQKDGKKPEPCKPILKVEYKTSRSGDTFVIFSGGLAYDKAGRRPSLTVMQGKDISVLEMDFPIVDFITLCETPYPSDFQDPYAVVVLHEKDLVVIDLTQNSYPVFDNPYAMDIHESPVTCCEYFADCPMDVIPALYSVGAKQKRQGYSKKEWPINGGSWELGTQSFPEIIITGHADGSVKFWDASAISLQHLYRLKTSKVFEKAHLRDLPDEDPFAVQILSWCPESRVLCVTGVSAHVIMYRFSRFESNVELVALEVRMQSDADNDESPQGDQSPLQQQQQAVVTRSHSVPIAESNPNTTNIASTLESLKVKSNALKQQAGYQAELAIQSLWVYGEPPQQITSLELNSAYSLVAFGNSNGLAIVDYLQKSILLNVSTMEIYNLCDPSQRQLRSPRKGKQSGSGDITDFSGLQESERSKSPTSGDHSQEDKVVSKTWLRVRNKITRPTMANIVTEIAKHSRKLSLPTHQKLDFDTRESSFSRSRSSSVSSIDKEAREVITAIRFADSITSKYSVGPTPCLWLGTSLGIVLGITLNLPLASADDQKGKQPGIVLPSGTVFKLKGAILRLAFLATDGSLLPAPAEAWWDAKGPEEKEATSYAKRKATSLSTSPSNQELPAGLAPGTDSCYALLCSEKQAKVVSLPTQSCIHRHSITETSFVLHADAVSLAGSVCLACFCANGHIMTFSLPSLRPLLDVNYLPVTDMRIARTFCFAHEGQALYLSSPTEIQRLTFSQEMCENLQEMLGELFTPVETPEAPNRGFFKGFFGGNAPCVDREELFGEAAGRASRNLAQHVPGPGSLEGVRCSATGVAAELARARLALDERGQHLGELDERTAAMAASAEVFSRQAYLLMTKYKDKRWYQF
uniref:syntaxin-binding protein 5-like isoform X2 n=1 Tax=Myxine glutinosa TaxID=7769 RepID=UPI00358E3052